MCAFYAQRTLYFSLLDCLGVDDHSARLCSVVIFSHIFTLSPTFHSFMQRQFNEHARLAFFYSPLYTARQLLCDNLSIVPLKSSMKTISVGIHTCIYQCRRFFCFSYFPFLVWISTLLYFYQYSPTLMSYFVKNAIKNRYQQLVKQDLHLYFFRRQYLFLL
jgi:hypothetical protein